MAKKNEKRLCWNCHGNVSLVLTQCPYCGVDLTDPAHAVDDVMKGGSPFQRRAIQEEEVLASPYGSSQEFAVTDEEWNQSLEQEKAAPTEEGGTRNEMTALLLLLPGVVFFLFAFALLFFSQGGVLTLQWNESFAYFYFFGAIPLLFFGWRSLK